MILTCLIFLITLPLAFGLDSKEILISRFRFDPLTKEAGIPIDLTMEEDTGYYIIQFKEPTKKEWIQEIERMGGHNYGGIPQNAALIRMDPSKKKEIEALPYVRWFGVFQPAYKLSIPLIGTYSSGGLNNPKENVNYQRIYFGCTLKQIYLIIMKTLN